MQESYKTIIDSAQSILILIPEKPSFDQVAAALSLYLSLSSDKSVSVVCPVLPTVEYNRLVGVNKITQDVGNKNLVIKFLGYKADDIERVSYDIENREFRLTVIPKPGITAPEKGQVDLSYSGISSDLVILVGGENESNFPALSNQELVGAKIVYIGNKQFTSDKSRNVVSFAGDSASISEMVAYFINETQLKADSDVATNLLMGIEDGTQNFMDGKTNAQTFQLIASLMQLGGKRIGQQQPLRAQDFPQGSIPDAKANPVQQATQTQQVAANLNEKTEETPIQAKTDNALDEDNAPKDWFEPKIYKGTSVN